MKQDKMGKILQTPLSSLAWCINVLLLNCSFYSHFYIGTFQMGYTALHRAAAQGHLDVIKVLLAEGAIVDRQDEVVRSPDGSAA